MCLKCNDTSCTGHCNSLPKGLRGPRGYQGEKGDKGDKGNTGLIGPQGPQGIQGLAGVNGGFGIQGIQGPIGAQGTNGAPGLPGANGINGTNGVDGPPGLTGKPGANGDAGPQGEVGPQGLPGANAFKFIKEFATNFDAGTVVITRAELILCADVPIGCLAADALTSMVDFQIEMWAMITEPTPTGTWVKVKDSSILSTSVDGTTGDITIILTGGALDCNLRVVILA